MHIKSMTEGNIWTILSFFLHTYFTYSSGNTKPWSLVTQIAINISF